MHMLKRITVTKAGRETRNQLQRAENQGNMMKLSESECLWRSELKVVTDEATRMNVSIRAYKISAQGNSNGYAGPNIRTGTQY